jgi:hypothetical protein
MKFLGLYRPAAPEGTPPSQENIARMGQLIEEMTKAGVLLASEGCMPSSKGARVRYSGGKFTVTDGPFAETKELIAGFALFEVKSKEEAIAWSRRFMEVAGEGENEIRQIYEGGTCAPESTTEYGEVEHREPAQVGSNL